MARRIAAALALLVLAASCGDRQDSERSGGAQTATSSDAPTTTATTSGEVDDGPTPTTTRAGTATTQVPGRTRPTSGRADTSTKPRIDSAANSSVGGFAGVLLAAGIAERLVLDVRIAPGATPSAEALNGVASSLRSLSGKPVDIVGPLTLTGADRAVYSADDIRSLATKQGAPNRDGVAVVHFLYLNGRFAEEASLGVAVRGDTVAIFPEVVASSSSPFASRARIERAVAVHELGHLLGLVDLFIDRNREDPEHPGHSQNRDSVMFWAVETSLVGQIFGGPPPVEFDGDDRADLQQIRAGAARA